MSETEDYSKAATPTAHKTSHQDVGTDEMSVAGLSGQLVDIQPSIQNRGDPSVVDFVLTDFPVTDAWTELDLSNIVPANFNFVLIRAIAYGPGVNNFFALRKHGMTNFLNATYWKIQVANADFDVIQIVWIDSNRHVDYYLVSGTLTSLNLVICGWGV